MEISSRWGVYFIVGECNWSLIELLKGKKAIRSKWVLRIKQKENDEMDQYKTQLAVKGFAQRSGIDFFKTYTLVC